MKTGTRHLVRTKKRVRLEGALSGSHITSWIDWMTQSEDQSMIRRGVHAAQLCSEQRAMRVEELRARVQACTYTIDSRVLAERLLKNETHLTDEQER